MHLESTPAGLSIHVDTATQPGLRLESSRSRRLRLVAGGEAVFWARIENGYYGVWALRQEKKPTIVRAIRADEARAGRDMGGWMRWFAHELLESDASPMSTSHWHLTELIPKPSSTWSDLFVPRNDGGLPGPAFDLMSSLERPLITYEDWGSNGSAGVIPLRRRSPSDAARVKSWTKHARDETLPPILLWWVGALDAHLILDGHDRLAAAVEAGVKPRVLTLWQSIDEPVEVDPEAQAHFIENYLQLMGNPNVELMARRQLNAKLIAKHRDECRRRVTHAKANPALDESWDAEVRAAAPEDSDDLEDMLWND